MSLLILMTGLVSGCLQPVKAAMISVVVIRCFMRLFLDLALLQQLLQLLQITALKEGEQVICS